MSKGLQFVTVLGLAVAIAVFVFGCERRALDSKLEELCAIDGGTNIYETVQVSPSEYERIFTFVVRAKSQEDYYGPHYRYEQRRDVLFGKYLQPEQGRAQLTRWYSAIRRRSDNRLLGESVSYFRTGGDVLTFGMPHSSKTCPRMQRDLGKEIFVKTEQNRPPGSAVFSDLPRNANAAEPSITVSDFADYARAFDWTEINPSAGTNLNCGELLAGLRMPQYKLHAALPRVESNSSTDPAFARISSCKNLDTEQRANAVGPNNYIVGVEDFGDELFRLYSGIAAHGMYEEGHIVYGEYSAAKNLTNAYSNGYTALDLRSCTKLGHVPVQRPLQGDEKHGAARQVAHGLFVFQRRTIVITATEQVGKLNDPAAFRAITAWALDHDGRFSQSCTWAPKALVSTDISRR